MSERILFEAKNVNGNDRGLFGRKKFALKNVNFSLPEGYIMGVTGRNGAGKTTFFDYIMNRKKQYTGSFELCGTEIHENTLDFLDDVGFVSEECLFAERLSAEENAEMLGKFYSRYSHELFLELMEDNGVRADMPVSRMSKGQNTRFQLAFAMAHEPLLLLLDEPTAGMDPVFKNEFYRIIRKWLDKGGSSVIMSSHLEEDIENQFDYVCTFEEGNFTDFRVNEIC